MAPRPSPHPETFTNLYVPILNIQSADIYLRPEFLALLPCANIEPSDLITLDDLASISHPSAELKPENTKWILVDHNALQGSLGERYGSRVQGVIDHHDEESVIPMHTGDEPRIVEKSGSCTSLVTGYCREYWDKLPMSAISLEGLVPEEEITAGDTADDRVCDAQLAQLALAPVLIDTANLTSKSKVTLHDIRAVSYLEAKIAMSPQIAVNYDRGAFFEKINNAKQDVERLALGDILRKDYKEWTENRKHKLGVSSVVKSLSWQINHAGVQGTSSSSNNHNTNFFNTIRAFVDDRKLAIYMIMTAFTDPQGRFQRELFVWAVNPSCNDSLELFSKRAKEEIGLEDWHEEDIGFPRDDLVHLRIWVQKNVDKSRKQVAPLLRQCMSQT